MADDDKDVSKQLEFSFIVNGKPRRAANSVDDETKVEIFRLRTLGFIQSDIAAIVGTNQGRVSEVLRGLR